MTLIVLSVGTFIAETMPEFKEDLKKVEEDEILQCIS